MGWFGPSMNRVKENRDQAEEGYNAWVAHRDNMQKKGMQPSSSQTGKLMKAAPIY